MATNHLLGLEVNLTTIPLLIPPVSLTKSSHFNMNTVTRLLPIAAISVYGNRIDSVVLIAYKMWKDWKFVQAHLRQLTLQVNFHLVFVLASLLATFLVLLQVQRCIKGFQEPSTDEGKFIAKPMLFPSRTAHTRFFPKKNSFSYPYIVVGVPVGWKGTIGGMLSVDLPRDNQSLLQRLFSFKPWSSWYTVDADDHLARGHVEGGLEEKLHHYLLSQVSYYTLLDGTALTYPRMKTQQIIHTHISSPRQDCSVITLTQYQSGIFIPPRKNLQRWF